MNLILNPNNRLFTLARSGQRQPHIMLAIVLSLVIIFASLVFGNIFYTIIKLIQLIRQDFDFVALDLSDEAAIQEFFYPSTGLELLILLIFSFGPIFILVWLVLRFFEKRPLSSTGMEWGDMLWKYGRGVLVGLVMFTTALGISAIFGYIDFEAGDTQKQGLSVLGSVLFIYLGWTIQGPAEELITRGWLLPVIGARYSPVWGIIISSVIFALMHSLNLNLSFVALLNLFLFGLFAALYALYEESLWGVFSIHAVWNWVQGNIFGFEVSGNPVAGGILVNLQEVGPDLITGGPFGPEGGLAVTIVLLIGCGVVWWLSQNKEANEPIAEAE